MIQEEMLDVVDKYEERIRKAIRSECHKNSELIHTMVQFTLVDSDKERVLVTQRSFMKR